LNTPARVGVVHLVVSDHDRSVEFYQQIIGFDILTSDQ
jgi:catechol-2,3-dioxygenase